MTSCAAVLASGRPMAVNAREALMLQRRLVNSAQRLELTGLVCEPPGTGTRRKAASREIIRFQTRLFIPLEGAAQVLDRLAEGNLQR
jgi:hypothetical protein